MHLLIILVLQQFPPHFLLKFKKENCQAEKSPADTKRMPKGWGLKPHRLGRTGGWRSQIHWKGKHHLYHWSQKEEHFEAKKQRIMLSGQTPSLGWGIYGLFFPPPPFKVTPTREPALYQCHSSQSPPVRSPSGSVTASHLPSEMPRIETGKEKEKKNREQLLLWMLHAAMTQVR